MSPTRVLLHVGTPKTGTSYLQDVLFRNRDHLEARGILYAADRFDPCPRRSRQPDGRKTSFTAPPSSTATP